jgi:hypothetical protein
MIDPLTGRSAVLLLGAQTIGGMLRLSVQSWFAVVFMIVIFTFGVALDSASNKRRATELLVRRMAEMKVGTSSFTEARAMAEEHGGKPTRENCSAQACTFTFVIDNKPLSYIPGVSVVQFVATIGVKDGYVSERQIRYAILNRTGADFAYLLTDQVDLHGFDVQKLKVDANGMPHVLKVSLGQSATADERKRAYSIGFSCLARLSGCRHASAVFPSGL